MAGCTSNPPPYVNLVRYSGVLASASKWRRWIVPRVDESAECRRSWRARSRHSERYYAWAELLKRVFAVDAFECPNCSEQLRLLSVINPPEAIKAILTCLNLSPNPPPIAPGRVPEEYFF